MLRRRWLDEHAYWDLVSLCQFLPGPASSQVGIAVGIARAGLLGGLAAWVGFTLPSALLLVAFAYGTQLLAPEQGAGWFHGLKVLAVAVVAQAVWSMVRSLAPDRPRITLAILSGVAVLAWPVAAVQLIVIAAGALVGWRSLPPGEEMQPARLRLPYGRRVAAMVLIVFLALLVLLPLARQAFPNQTLAVIDSFYRSGSLVFGGGHVVLPLLRAEVVPPGWASDEQFLAGYGAAQAVPGPLFTFAAYLGAIMVPPPDGWLGAAIALVSIFAPSFLLVVGALPFWDELRSHQGAQSALRGINAAVVGVLLAALYNPVWTSAIVAPLDFALATVAFGLLMFWRVPPVIVVVACATGGFLLSSM